MKEAIWKGQKINKWFPNTWKNLNIKNTIDLSSRIPPHMICLLKYTKFKADWYFYIMLSERNINWEEQQIWAEQ